MYLQIWGIFGSDIKRRTSLCLAKADLSHKCCVSAVASCLVFFRSDWVPCSMCYVRFVLATALTQKLRIFSASLFAICLLWCEFVMLGPFVLSVCFVASGWRLEANGLALDGRPVRVKVCGGSECVLFEKCGPDFEPIFWPRFRGQKLGSA